MRLPAGEWLGRKDGRLTVVAFTAPGPGGRMLTCACECGGTVAMKSESFVRQRKGARPKSCDACRQPAKGNLKHGNKRRDVVSPTYHSWVSMKNRCRNLTAPKAKYYAAKGIDYEARWEDYEAFLEDMGERPAGHTLDRIDGRLGYFRENCRWATPYVQTHNRTRYAKSGVAA